MLMLGGLHKEMHQILQKQDSLIKLRSNSSRTNKDGLSWLHGEKSRKS